MGCIQVGSNQISYIREIMPAVLEWDITAETLTGSVDMPFQTGHSVIRNCIGGEEYLIHEDVFFVWRRQANGDYKIFADTSIVVTRERVW